MRHVHIILCLLAFSLGALPVATAQTGHVLNGVGPIDQSWSGAGMAAPRDGLTALHWNPAAIATFDASRLDVSLQLMFPTTDLASTIETGAMGPDAPPVRLSGTSASDTGPFPIPAVGFVYRPAHSRSTFGISAIGVGGFGVNYAASDPTAADGNPITFPQAAGGFGALRSSFSLFQVAPTYAFAFNERLSFGLAPTVNVGMLEVCPFPATSPDLNGYPDGPRATALGVGAQMGFHYATDGGLRAGISFKSPQFFQEFSFEYEGRTFAYTLDYPMIASVALAYDGLDRLTLVGDVRYIDFAGTDGFQAAAFDESGAVTGFGWESIWVAAVGLEYEVTDRLPVRLGYAYNENPIRDDVAFFNVASPAIVQHHLSAGFSYLVNDRVMASAAVQYAPRNAVTSAMQSPMMIPMTGQTIVPGTTVTSELSTLTAVVGVSYRF